ncbi:MAG: NAD(P)-dependent oxidoreductase, partial [Chloroflexi bacterium]|nr:NAD(P)-dependent oxidoreductase [Chloroflexota bacterium]
MSSLKVERLLITGGSGYVGQKLVAKASDRYDVLYTWFTHPTDIPGARSARLNLLDSVQVLHLFLDFSPHAVIHTAYSQENLEVIVSGTKHVVEASDKVGARLLHLSTDAVFDGERGWYRENDIPNPIHPYGKAKAEAEALIGCRGLQIGTGNGYTSGTRLDTELLRQRNAVIIRISLVWGLDPLDPRTRYIKERLEKGEKVVLFTDEYRCPIWVNELAAAILEILDSSFSGIIHVAGPKRMSRYEFGVLLAKNMGLNPKGITPGLSHESGLVRPRDCSLD